MTDEGQIDAPDERRSKVGRLVAAHGMDDLPDELETRWTAPRSERSSLRELAEYVNHRLVDVVLRNTGLHAHTATAEQTYRALTDEDVGTGERTRLRRELERAGVDVTELVSNFVSHQAVHTYLTKYRGVEHERDDDLTERSLRRIRRLQGRTAAVTTDTVERLVERGDAAGGELHVLLSAQVLCETCGVSQDATAFIENGGCGCE